jgi:hypothetical protein
MDRYCNHRMLNNTFVHATVRANTTVRPASPYDAAVSVDRVRCIMMHQTSGHPSHMSRYHA